METSAVLLQQGVELMLFGMGTVFVFLALLVACTSLMSALLRKYLPEEIPPVPPKSRQSGAKAATASPDAKTLAVIGAAIHQHRKRR